MQCWDLRARRPQRTPRLRRKWTARPFMHSRCKIIKADYVGCGYRVASAPNASLISRPPHVSGSGEGGFARPDARARYAKTHFRPYVFIVRAITIKLITHPIKYGDGYLFVWLFAVYGAGTISRRAARSLASKVAFVGSPPPPPWNRRNPPTTTAHQLTITPRLTTKTSLII